LKQNKLSEYKSDESDLMHLMIKDLIPLQSNEKIEKAFDVFILELRRELEKGLPVLGTLGSTTPFIGLLGTILGIIVSFGALSNGTGDMNTVMFSLAEALLLTAVGLVVAIPAVISFNYFSRKARSVMSDLLAVKDLFIAYKD
jgi:biopolymer transport protein TolQ